MSIIPTDISKANEIIIAIAKTEMISYILSSSYGENSIY